MGRITKNNHCLIKTILGVCLHSISGVRAATNLENLEKSQNLTVVREKSGKL